MKTLIFHIAFLLTFVQVAFAKPKLHLIIFAATQDSHPKIAKGIKVSYQNMQMVWQIASQDADYELEEHIFVDQDFSLSALNQFLREFRCEPEDAVIFYFVGHGVAYQGQELSKQSWADLHFSKDFTKTPKDRFFQKNFQEIVQVLEKQNPHLLLALSESCNNTALEEQTLQVQAMPRGSAAGIRALLAGKGVFMLASSERNQVSYMNSQKGGIFNIAFYDAFLEVRNQPSITWKKFIALIQEKSRKISEKCPTIQVPYALRK